MELFRIYTNAITLSTFQNCGGFSFTALSKAKCIVLLKFISNSA